MMPARAPGPPKKIILSIIALVFLLSSVRAVAAVPAESQDLPSFKESWGIEIVSVRLSAAGNMVDFRYRVVDAAKATPLFERNNKPYLLHQASGKVLSVPRTAKVGPLRSSNQPKQDRVYWMFFGNQSKLVQSGDKVTVTIGEFKVADLTVQ